MYSIFMHGGSRVTEAGGEGGEGGEGSWADSPAAG